MANPDGRIPNISLNDCVLGLTGEESFIGREPVTLRASTDSLRRSEVVSNLGLAGEEGFIGMHRLRASTNSLRRPGVYTNQAYDNYLACEDYQPENQYEDLASVVAKQNAPRKKANDVYESATSRSPERRRKQNELYQSSVCPPPAVKPRSRNATECSDVSLGSLQSYFEPSPRQSCLHNLVLFLVLVFSTAAFVLVILQLFGIVGMQCGCNKSNEADGREGRTGQSSGTDAKILEAMKLIEELKQNLTRLQKTMDTRDEQHQFKEEQYKNETANKISRVNALVVNLTSWMPPTVELSSKISAIKDDVNFTQHQVEEVNSTQRKYANETQARVRQIEEGEINLSHAVSKLKNKTREHELFLQSSVHDLQKNLSHRINPVYAKMNNLSQWVSTLTKLVDELKAVKVANFSSCQFIEGGQRTPATIKPSGITTATATYTLKVGKKVVGATCMSTFKPSHVELSKDQSRYICTCTVQRQNPTTVYICKIFVWECSTS